eukprot:TRINITY_DN6942_c0_g1_i1.p1 TRINITY_DN6942_c0_g1~~TRINITY_DN6942_c0_g1_i1.p1  ORF type:complete len:669 (+),score=118.44 TRINITY_DN6942_c0_g1_i1:49-2007(+)
MALLEMFSLDGVDSSALVQEMNVYEQPISDRERKIMIEVTKGFKAQSQAEYDIAILRYDRALEFSKVPLLVSCFIHSNLCRCYQITGDRIRANEHAQQQLQLLKENQNDTQIRSAANQLLSHAHSDLGIVHYSQNKYQDALLEFQLALAYATRFRHEAGYSENAFNNSLLSQCEGNLGNTYACLGKFKQALQHHSEQLRLAESLDHDDPERKECIKKAHYNLSSDYNSLKKPEQASRHVREAELILVAETRNEAAETRPGPVSIGDSMLSSKHSHSGWLVKHPGANVTAPSRLARKLRWCVLANNTFQYQDTTSNIGSPERCVRMQDISDVIPVSLTADERAAGRQRSFKLVTTTRCFYFTAASEAELRDWLFALEQARMEVIQFAHFTTLQRTHGEASKAFGGKPRGSSSAWSSGGMSDAGNRSQGRSPSNKGNALQQRTSEQIEMSPTLSTFDEAPDAFAEKSNVENPLYNSMFATDEGDEVQLTAFSSSSVILEHHEELIEDVDVDSIAPVPSLSTFGQSEAAHNEGRAPDDQQPVSVVQIAGLEQSDSNVEVEGLPSRGTVQLDGTANDTANNASVIDEEPTLAYGTPIDEPTLAYGMPLDEPTLAYGMPLDFEMELNNLDQLADATADLFQQLHVSAAGSTNMDGST